MSVICIQIVMLYVARKCLMPIVKYDLESIPEDFLLNNVNMGLLTEICKVLDQGLRNQY